MDDWYGICIKAIINSFIFKPTYFECRTTPSPFIPTPDINLSKPSHIHTDGSDHGSNLAFSVLIKRTSTWTAGAGDQTAHRSFGGQLTLPADPHLPPALVVVCCQRRIWWASEYLQQYDGGCGTEHTSSPCAMMWLTDMFLYETDKLYLTNVKLTSHPVGYRVPSCEERAWWLSA